MTDRIRRWKKRDVWKLREACDLSFGFIPHWLFRIFNLNDADADDLFDYAVRAVMKNNLKVRNRSEAPREWWVDQEEIGQWLGSRADLIGQVRAEIFRTQYPSPGIDARKEIRKRILESSYTSPEFEAALAAIAEFWISA